jgi:hypothetical protein
VTIIHRGGGDFTPDSGITGFGVLDDDSLVGIVRADKVDQTHIRLTLSRPVAGTGSLRYLYGKAPDVAGPVRDNTPLRLPLEPTTQPVPIRSPTRSRP